MVQAVSSIDARMGPLSVLAGPTASGKTALAVAVARAGDAEILSMDSMLVYRGMDVGTAKPTPAERAAQPHALIDLVEPTACFSVVDWLPAAEAALIAARARGRRALFVGGTAFYLRALIDGLFSAPAVAPALRERLEARYEREGAPALMRELERVDPSAARRLHPNDKKRVVRALEVWHQTGRALSDWQQQWGAGARASTATRIVALTVDAAQLDLRIARRLDVMLEAGFADEVRALSARGGWSATSRQALGYMEMLEHVEGRADLATTRAAIALRTRQFARKQRTWLRHFEERVDVPAPRSEDGADMQRAASEVLAALGW